MHLNAILGITKQLRIEYPMNCHVKALKSHKQAIANACINTISINSLPLICSKQIQTRDTAAPLGMAVFSPLPISTCWPLVFGFPPGAPKWTD